MLDDQQKLQDRQRRCPEANGRHARASWRMIREQHLGPAEQGLTRATKSLEDEAALAEASRSDFAQPRMPDDRTGQPQPIRRRADVKTARRRSGAPPVARREGCQEEQTCDARKAISAMRPRRATSAGDASKGSNKQVRHRRGTSERGEVGQAKLAKPEAPPAASPTQAGQRIDTTRAGRVEDEPEGDRRRASEDARRLERV